MIGNAKPFLRWAGGKRQLLPQILPIIRESLQAGPVHYIEPFVGGGAVLFAVLVNFPKLIKRVGIYDVNHQLIDCYNVVTSQVDDLLVELGELKADEKTYAYMATLLPANVQAQGPVFSAARMVFLNKLAYNGLYRVNKLGKFNVPLDPSKIGREVVDEPTLRGCSEALQKVPVAIHCQDFRKTLAGINPDKLALVYADPPYYPASQTSSFVAYATGGFDRKDHEDLATGLEGLTSPWLLSYGDVPWVQARYKTHKLTAVSARRNINCKSSKRGKVAELLIQP
jgi:DNA adenine methylase